MTRAKRCHVPGAVYWVDVEGIAEIQAFPDESDYLAYIKDVMAYAVKYDAKVLAYLIESNRA